MAVLVSRCAILCAGLAAALAIFALPDHADAWWRARAPSYRAGYAWGPGPWVLFPFQRPHPEYRYSVPPGAPLSYDDPASGTTYCWSQTTGFYFVCAYALPDPVSAMPPPPMPPALVPPPGAPTAHPASGVLMFQLPEGARATIDGVPIGLSGGFGIHALRPGAYRVVLNVNGQETTHTVNVLAHRVFSVTPAGIVATEP